MPGTLPLWLSWPIHTPDIQNPIPCHSTGFYSIIPDQPDSRETLANNGKGSYLGWSKAAFWKFEGGTCTLYDSDKSFTPEHIIISLKVV